MGRRLLEQRRRGPIGLLVKYISWAVHLFIGYATYLAFTGRIGEIDPEYANADPGSLGVMTLVGWGVVALILAFINFLFRGKREYVEQVDDT